MMITMYLVYAPLFKEISDIVDELDYADLFVLWNTDRLLLVYEYNTSRDTTFDNELFLNYQAYCPIWMVYTHRKTKQLFVSRCIYDDLVGKIIYSLSKLASEGKLRKKVEMEEPNNE